MPCSSMFFSSQGSWSSAFLVPPAPAGACQQDFGRCPEPGARRAGAAEACHGLGIEGAGPEEGRAGGEPGRHALAAGQHELVEGPLAQALVEAGKGPAVAWRGVLVQRTVQRAVQCSFGEVAEAVLAAVLAAGAAFSC